MATTRCERTRVVFAHLHAASDSTCTRSYLRASYCMAGGDVHPSQHEHMLGKACTTMHVSEWRSVGLSCHGLHMVDG